MIPCPKLNNRDPAYFKHWQGLCRRRLATCFVTGLYDETLIPHHVLGRAIHGDKNNIVPVSFRPHQCFHQDGESVFVAKYGVTVEQMQEEARRLYQLYLEMIGGVTL